MPDAIEIPLADAIRALRSELTGSVRAARAEPMQFTLGPIELELKAVASTKGGVEAGVKWCLVSFGAKISESEQSTQKIKLTLTPVQMTAQGEATDVRVGARRKTKRRQTYRVG